MYSITILGMGQLKSSSDCIIHCTDDNTELISLKDVASWNTLYDAAALRQYASLLPLQYEGEIPNIRYHRKCRQIFTMKRELDKMREKKGHSKKNKKYDCKSKKYTVAISIIFYFTSSLQIL